MAAKYLVIWLIDKGQVESARQRKGESVPDVEMLSENVKREIRSYNCIRFHAVNGYGCAFLDGKLRDIMLDLQKYRPFLSFKFLPVEDISRVGELFEKMKEREPSFGMETVLGSSLENCQKALKGERNIDSGHMLYARTVLSDSEQEAG